MNSQIINHLNYQGTVCFDAVFFKSCILIEFPSFLAVPLSSTHHVVFSAMVSAVSLVTSIQALKACHSLCVGALGITQLCDRPEQII